MWCKKNYVLSIAFVCCVFTLITSCDIPTDDTDTKVNDVTAVVGDANEASVSGSIQSYKIVESGQVTLKNLTDKQVFTVAVNKAASFVNYSNAGSVVSYTLNGIKHQVAPAGRSAFEGLSDTPDRNTSFVEQGDKIPIQYDKREASEFNSAPLPIPSILGKKDSARALNFIPLNVGDKRLFWLDDSDRTNTWKEKQATLAVISNHAEIWILDEYYSDNSENDNNKLSTIQARIMAEKFDAIYQYTTPVFGYEYGGGRNSPQPGGVDENPRIIILVYDIGANSSSGGTVGYFWSKDHYTNEYLQSQGSGYKSNHSEIFYIDSYWANIRPETVYSALIHEFVHMINFNEKYVKYNKTYSTWYTEMLAMLGEDIIGPLIGISPESSGHPIKTRIPYTLGLYLYDPTFWSGSMSYGITYGFGAYLARNYGGAALIKEIAQNDKTNIDSLSAALTVCNTAMDFTKAVERYHEAFICNDTGDNGTASFNKSITDTIDGYQYTFYGFDIYQTNRVNVALGQGIISYWSTAEKGPFLYSLTQNYLLDYYSFVLLSCADWQNVSGDLEVDVKKPASLSVNMHLIVK